MPITPCHIGEKNTCTSMAILVLTLSHMITDFLVFNPYFYLHNIHDPQRTSNKLHGINKGGIAGAIIKQNFAMQLSVPHTTVIGINTVIIICTGPYFFVNWY